MENAPQLSESHNTTEPPIVLYEEKQSAAMTAKTEPSLELTCNVNDLRDPKFKPKGGGRRKRR